MANRPDTVPLLLCCNAEYAQHMTVCIVSLLENNQDLNFDVKALISFDDKPIQEKIAQSVLRYANVSLSLIPFHVPDHIRMSNPYYPRDIMARMWIADFIDDKKYPRALYMDADMVVLSEIRQLWNTSLDGKAFGAVSIPGSTRGIALGLPKEYGYFNSGLLLIDLAEWVTKNVQERVLEMVNNSTMLLGTPEQDALNALFYSDRKCLDYVWNAISPFFWDKTFIPLDENQRTRVCRGAKILHFNGRSKPWSYMNQHPRREEYFKYLEKTEWCDYRFPDRTLLNIFKKHAGSFVPGQMR